MSERPKMLRTTFVAIEHDDDDSLRAALKVMCRTALATRSGTASRHRYYAFRATVANQDGLPVDDFEAAMNEHAAAALRDLRSRIAGHEPSRPRDTTSAADSGSEEVE